MMFHKFALNLKNTQIASITENLPVYNRHWPFPTAIETMFFKDKSSIRLLFNR